MKEINDLVEKSGYSILDMRKRGVSTPQIDRVVRLLCLHLYNIGWEINEIGLFFDRKYQSITRCIQTAKEEVNKGDVSALNIAKQLNLTTDKRSILIEMSFVCKCGCEFKRKITPPKKRSIWVKCNAVGCGGLIKVCARV